MTNFSRLSSTDFRFGYKISFVRDTEDPARVFRALSELVKFSQSLDRSLIRALNIEVEPILLLDDIQEGSVVSWLRNVFSSSDEEKIEVSTLNKLNAYLNQARGLFIDFLNKRETINELSEASELQTKLLVLAENSKVSPLTICGPVSHKDLLDNSEKYQQGLRELGEQDELQYLQKNINLNINTKFRLSKENVENILLNETLSSEKEMILKIKKPDYLGDSKWIFRHGKRMIEAKIDDLEWIKSFKGREVPIIPGDSLRAIVKVVTKYDFNGEVLAEQTTIQKVIEVIPDISKQLELFKE